MEITKAATLSSLKECRTLCEKVLYHVENNIGTLLTDDLESLEPLLKPIFDFNIIVDSWDDIYTLVLFDEVRNDEEISAFIHALLSRTRLSIEDVNENIIDFELNASIKMTILEYVAAEFMGSVTHNVDKFDTLLSELIHFMASDFRRQEISKSIIDSMSYVHPKTRYQGQLITMVKILDSGGDEAKRIGLRVFTEEIHKSIIAIDAKIMHLNIDKYDRFSILCHYMDIRPFDVIERDILFKEFNTLVGVDYD